jgi:hypothetical protein
MTGTLAIKISKTAKILLKTSLQESFSHRRAARRRSATFSPIRIDRFCLMELS